MIESDQLPPEEILYLSALNEVVGGFAHEIAQPLNAIMIAAQVVQLGINRSSLSPQEKSFILERLDIVSSQVQKTSKILELLRTFRRGNAVSVPQTTVLQAVQNALRVMGQQLTGRNIETVVRLNDPVPGVRLRNTIVASLIVQCLAFARDRVEQLSRLHDDKGMDYKMVLELDLFPSDRSSVLRISWNTGNIDEQGDGWDFPQGLGMQSAMSVLNSSGGSLELGPTHIILKFP